MQSSSHHPVEWPSGHWRTRANRIQMAAASSFLVAIAAVCVYLAWQGFQDGQYTRIKYLLGIVVFLAIATRFRTVYQPQRNGNLESDQGTKLLM